MRALRIGIYASSRQSAGFLLDTYTGAAVAYSLRQLKTGVTSVVRVRRSSDNSEQDFTATEVTDGTLASFCGAGDGFVVTWYDQSGNANHVTQSTAGNQPKIVSSGNLILTNSKPTIDFTGTVYLDGAASDLTDGNWLSFGVVQAYSAHNGQFFDNDDNSGTRVAQYLRARNTGVFQAISFDSSVPTIASTGNYTNNTQYVVSSDKTASSFVVYLNNVGGADAGALAQNTATDIFKIGASATASANPFNGDIQEIVHWGTDNSSNRAAIETAINSYYGVY